jgi:hypothetical protein
MTIAALYYWPWGITLDLVSPPASSKQASDAASAKNSALPSIFQTSESINKYVYNTQISV